MITIGDIAKTYGVLPSFVRDNATTFDLMVYDVTVAWEDYKQQRANGVNSPPNVSEEKLLEILQKSRE